MSAAHGTIERQCWCKLGYKTKAKAEQACRKMQWRAVLPLRVYRCQYCPYWHIARMRRCDVEKHGWA